MGFGIEIPIKATVGGWKNGKPDISKIESIILSATAGNAVIGDIYVEN